MKKRWAALMLLACTLLAANCMRTEGTRLLIRYHEPGVRRLPEELRNGPVAAAHTAAGAMDLYGESAVYQDARGRIHIVSAEGHDTAYEDIIGVFCLEHSDGRLFAVEGTDFLVGLCDSRGRQLLPRKYAGMEVSQDGRYVTAYGDYGGIWVYEVLDAR